MWVLSGEFKGLIKLRKCKNRVLSIPAIVSEDYDGGLISFYPSVTIYDLITNKEYFTTPECITSIDKSQYDELIKKFKNRKNKTEISFNLKKSKKIKKARKSKIIVSDEENNKDND